MERRPEYNCKSLRKPVRGCKSNIIYYRGKIVGGIYDDRLLVKQVESAISYMPTPVYELPYEGAKKCC